RKGAFESAIVSGYNAWEQTYRWMTRSGTIRLDRRPVDDVLTIRAVAPLDLIGKKNPELKTVRVNVQIESAPVGDFHITSRSADDFRITIPRDVVANLPPGPVSVRLTSDISWRPSEVLPTQDSRDLSIGVITMGFGVATNRSACSA